MAAAAEVDGDDTGAEEAPPDHHRSGIAALTLGALGIVYGDIGTSPIYAMREALAPVAADGLARSEVLGVISLLIWTLFLIVTAKYVMILLRADNQGEGGVLSLYGLVRLAIGHRSRVVLGLAMAGAALFFGDAAITPAISVLSAVEGLEQITPSLAPLVIPITLAILGALFIVQRQGTQAVSFAFGPVMALWFATLAGAGAVQIATEPGVLLAFNPYFGVQFLTSHRALAFVVLGAVFLAVTGAEALYADLGHFGKRPIRVAWFWMVFPALVVNYLGQGALVLRHPEAIENPFFHLVSADVLPFLVALAGLATVIASQAVISGAFSMTRAAIQLGFLPRFAIIHTSQREAGQIYIPAMNWLLLVAVVGLVLAFGSSAALASAYGIAVTGTMVVTTALAAVYARLGWRLPLGVIALVTAAFLVVEGAFLSANLLKLLDGGYMPVGAALLIGLLMFAWWRGTQLANERMRRDMVRLDSFVRSMGHSSVHVAKGTAFFLTSDPEAVPPALLHNLRHNQVLHDQTVILTVEILRVPHVAAAERAEYQALDGHFARLKLRFGFMDTPNLTRALGLARRTGLRFDIMTTTFFLGRRKVLPGSRRGVGRLLDRIFIQMSRFAADPSDYYHLPRDRVVELGTRLAI
jgi:KUP system potassium uptake protein